MPRYVAFLRGVSPGNASMPMLKRAFEQAGFGDVRPLLSSGNLAFDSGLRAAAALQARAETALLELLGRRFLTIVRPQATLARLIAADPFASHALPAGAKRVVTFLRARTSDRLRLPPPADGVHVLASTGMEIFTAYQPHPRGPVFMSVIEKLLGNEQTTRTWDTVRKCASA